MPPVALVLSPAAGIAALAVCCDGLSAVADDTKVCEAPVFVALWK